MNRHPSRTTRRAFFVRSGAVLGARVTAAVPAMAAAPAPSASAEAADREALRELHATFLRCVESARPAEALDLFDPHARLELSAPPVIGTAAIAHFFASRYASGDAPLRHTAYRRGATQPPDVIELRDGGTRATATFATEAELCTPLAATCTAAQMARLQGNVAERRWQPGRFDVSYVRSARGWRITDLRWSAA